MADVGTMNTKRLAAVVLALAITGACSSGSKSPSGSAAQAKWTSETKAAARQILAYTAQGSQLDCAVDVLTSVYSPEDWSYAVAHPIVNDQVPAGFPARLTALDEQSRKLMETRCGIKKSPTADR